MASSSSTSASQFTCAICLDPLEGHAPVVKIDCNCLEPSNMFHEHCIAVWIKRVKLTRAANGQPGAGGTCPTCQTYVKGGSQILKQDRALSGRNGGTIDLTHTEHSRCYFLDLTQEDQQDQQDPSSIMIPLDEPCEFVWNYYMGYD